MFRYIFGPVSSRRFGQSLGVDLSPEIKQCNFNCVYCELTKKRAISQMQKIAPVAEIFAELKQAIKEFENIDVITLTANGEPTLYPHFGELTKLIRGENFGKKLLVLSNAGRILENYESLLKCDIVKFSLDSVDEKIFKKIDNPKSEKASEIAQNIVKFRENFKGILVIEILVVKDINDHAENFVQLAKILKKIDANRVDIGTIDRPPAFDVLPVTHEKLEEMAEILRQNGVKNVSVIAKPNYKAEKLHFNEAEILATIKRRPQSVADIEAMFDKTSQITLQSMLERNLIELKNGFYRFKNL